MTKNDLDSMEANAKHTLVKKLLSEHLGLEADDIHLDDSLREDLHMSATELTDFVHELSIVGFEVNPSDLTTIETVEELLDKLIQEEI